MTSPNRIQVDGLELHDGFVLPSLAAAREDAMQIEAVLARSVQTVVFFRDTQILIACQPLGWYIDLENLFIFSFCVHREDMPVDLLEPSIWALKALKRIMKEASDAELLVLQSLLSHQEGEAVIRARKIFITNIHFKLGRYCLEPTINKPQESVKFLGELIEELHQEVEEPWVKNSSVYDCLAKALICVGGRVSYERAKVVLRCALQSTEMSITSMVGRRGLLARALRALDEDAEAQTEEDWLVKWYRKNPDLLSEKTLRDQLLISGTEPTLVLETLGGLHWLQNRRRTDKTDDRKTQECRQCQKRQPMVKLSQCAKCKYILYCSRECQSADWSMHKTFCKEMQAERRRIEDVSLLDRLNGQRAADWLVWRNASHEANSNALVHALGLHKDSSRGRTHIVLRKVKGNPESKTQRSKFHVTACGVFKIEDVLPAVGQELNLDAAEVQDNIQSLLGEVKGIPILSLSYGEGIDTYCGLSETSDSSLRSMEYNPNWRQTMNTRSSPPEHIQLWGGHVGDAEHVF